MNGPEGWGRSDGREVYQRLLAFVEANAGTPIFRVSMKGVKRVDISFASETIVELARRYRGSKGFCLTDLHDEDMIENWDAAAERKAQPLMLWTNDKPRVLGPSPSAGNQAALQFALSRATSRASEFAEIVGNMSIANASSKFKQLWEQGFLLRTESAADTGGVEYSYRRIA